MWMAIIKRRKTNEFYFPDEKWTHKRNFHLAQTGSYDTRAITWSSSGDKLFNFNAISCFYALNLMRVNSRLIVCRPLIRLCTFISMMTIFYLSHQTWQRSKECYITARILSYWQCISNVHLEMNSVLLRIYFGASVSPIWQEKLLSAPN